MTGENVQYKVLNESSIILSCFAAFNTISGTFLFSSNNWHIASLAFEAANLCFIFRLTPFKANFVSHYIANSCLTNLHISHIIQPSAPPALYNAQEKRAPDWVEICIPHPVALRWMTSWLAVNRWMAIRISDNCLIRCVYTWYQTDCLIGWMVDALTVDI